MMAKDTSDEDKGGKTATLKKILRPIGVNDRSKVCFYNSKLSVIKIAK